MCRMPGLGRMPALDRVECIPMEDRRAVIQSSAFRWRVLDFGGVNCTEDLSSLAMALASLMPSTCSCNRSAVQWLELKVDGRQKVLDRGLA